MRLRGYNARKLGIAIDKTDGSLVSRWARGAPTDPEPSLANRRRLTDVLAPPDPEYLFDAAPLDRGRVGTVLVEVTEQLARVVRHLDGLDRRVSRLERGASGGSEQEGRDG